MTWIGWLAIEVFLCLVVVAINLTFRLYERTAAKARQLRSEKARVGLRTVLYTVVAGLGLVIFGLESIVQSGTLVASALVALTLLLLGSFIVATLETAGEPRRPEETGPEASVDSAS